MKMLFPKHIDRGFFGMVNFRIWPFTLGFGQLILLAIWWAMMFGVMNWLMKWWTSRWTAMIISLPILLIFAFIAFFKISELWLLPFIAKLARTHIFNTARKFQVNFVKASQIDVFLSKFKTHEKKETINYKKISDINLDFYQKIKQEWLVA